MNVIVSTTSVEAPHKAAMPAFNAASPVALTQ
jgi:hypothetical protein